MKNAEYSFKISESFGTFTAEKMELVRLQYVRNMKLCMKQMEEN